MRLHQNIDLRTRLRTTIDDPHRECAARRQDIVLARDVRSIFGVRLTHITIRRAMPNSNIRQPLAVHIRDQTPNVISRAFIASRSQRNIGDASAPAILKSRARLLRRRRTGGRTGAQSWQNRRQRRQSRCGGGGDRCKRTQRRWHRRRSRSNRLGRKRARGQWRIGGQGDSDRRSLQNRRNRQCQRVAVQKA